MNKNKNFLAENFNTVVQMNAAALKKIMQIFGLKPLFVEPTRINNNSANCLNYVFVNKQTKYKI